MPALIRIALNEMFEEDTRKILPLFNSIEDYDTIPQDEEDMSEDQEVSTQGLDPSQSTTQVRRLTPCDFMPQLNILCESRRVFLDAIGAEGERALSEASKNPAELWNGLDQVIRKIPVVQLFSSESFRRERTQVRILKTKSRLVKLMERFVTQPWQ